MLGYLPTLRPGTALNGSYVVVFCFCLMLLLGCLRLAVCSTVCSKPNFIRLRRPCQVMPTLIASASLWYSQRRRRWLSLRELPVLQGFPAFKDLSYGRSCCSFSVRDRGLSDWPARGALCRMCGNSMHVHVCAVVMLFVWSQIAIDIDMFKLVRMTAAPQRSRTVLKRTRVCDVESVDVITSPSGPSGTS